jgi:uncharacterized protein
MFKRNLNLETFEEETFFLWGPRQTGKTTLLKHYYQDALWVDLLKSDQYRKYLQSPHVLRETILANPSIQRVVVDEIQKVPQLLDEIHWILENSHIKFALCGSSARKVKRGHANLLGGRAARLELFGLCASEIKESFNLTRLMNQGYLPRHYSGKNPKRMLNGYISDYLKQEIAAEGLIRNLPAFADFLSASALSDGEIVNYSTIARDCGVSSNTVQSYFEILEDTLMASFLPSYRKRLKRRTIRAPKFYFSDVGVVNFLCKRGSIEPGSELFGKAFENWIYHELRTYISYKEVYADISYWRLASGIEVDFVINDFELAIEAKSSSKIKPTHLKGLKALSDEISTCKQKIIVCLESTPRKTADNILILPYTDFVDRLWNGELF